MKSKLLPDLQAVSDDPVFSVTANEIGASFVSRGGITINLLFDNAATNIAPASNQSQDRRTLALTVRRT